MFVGEGGVNLTFTAWELPLICFAWKILKTLGPNIEKKGAPPKIIFISDLSFELCTAANPYFHQRGAFLFTFMLFYFYVESSPSQTSASLESTIIILMHYV